MQFSICILYTTIFSRFLVEEDFKTFLFLQFCQVFANSICIYEQGEPPFTRDVARDIIRGIEGASNFTIWLRRVGRFTGREITKSNGGGGGGGERRRENVAYHALADSVWKGRKKMGRKKMENTGSTSERTRAYFSMQIRNFTHRADDPG